MKIKYLHFILNVLQKKKKLFFQRKRLFNFSLSLSFFPLAVANVKQRKTKNLIFHFLEVSKSKYIFQVFSCSKSFFLLINDVMKLWGKRLLTVVSICLKVEVKLVMKRAYNFWARVSSEFGNLGWSN